SSGAGNRVIANQIHDPFAGNTSSTSAFYGIYHSSTNGTSGNENQVINNAIYNINGGGALTGIYNSSSGFVQYYHNTVDLADANYSGSSTARGFYQLTSANGIELKNNIFSITRSGTGTNHGIYKGTAATPIVSDYNDFHINGSGSNHVGYSGSNQTTLANWQSTS